jgi:thiol:disulfide interchange protein DsbA
MSKFVRILAGTSLALALLSGTALAATTATDIREGREYSTLTQTQPTDAKGKIEVTEFFWYGCPHCHEFEPVLEGWLKTLPKDVSFRRVPADFGRWTGGSKLYYTLEALGELERLHRPVFDAIHRERLNFNNPDKLADWMAKKGVDRKKFLDAYNSFGVQSNVSRAQQLTQAHGLNGVPAIIVGGRYITNNIMANGFPPIPGIINHLVDKLRAAPGRK